MAYEPLISFIVACFDKLVVLFYGLVSLSILNLSLDAVVFTHESDNTVRIVFATQANRGLSSI